MIRTIRPVARAASLHESVQASIMDYIRQNGLKPDDLLQSESELARQLGVSRSSVREAVKALESIGVLETRQGSGVRVASFSFAPLLERLPYGLMDRVGINELSELLDIRLVLESGMIAQAMAALSDDDRLLLTGILKRMRERADRNESFPEEDREFHRTLFAGLRNKTLLKLLDVFWLAFTKAMEEVDIRDTNPLQTYEDHAVIVDAVLAEDPNRARAALVDRHYAGIASRIQAAKSDL